MLITLLQNVPHQHLVHQSPVKPTNIISASQYCMVEHVNTDINVNTPITKMNGVFKTVLVEQNANIALAMSDRAYVMESGEITITGSGEDLSQDPRIHTAYLGA